MKDNLCSPTTLLRFLTLALGVIGILLGTTATHAGAAAARGLEIQRLRCEYGENPVAIDVLRPRLSWQLQSGERGQRQTAYQVLVASSESLLRENRGDLWDTGKVVSDQSVHVVYAGSPLRTGQRCWWKVRVWDRDGRDAGTSKPAFWEMGLLSPGDWKARWISVPVPESDASTPFTGAAWIWGGETAAVPNAPEPERLFRRAFTLSGAAPIQRARLWLTADDQFVLYLDKKRIGGSSGQADAWKQPRFFDLTESLSVGGRHVLEVRARNTGGQAGVLGKLVVEYVTPGVPPLIVVTDVSWKTAPLPSESAEATVPPVAEAALLPAREIAPYGKGVWGTIGETAAPGRFLRRRFTLGKPIKQARLYATALGVYEPYLNGKRVGNDVFAPGWTDYRKRVAYQTFDVTRLLRRGDNALGLILGDGWYSGHVGLAGRAVYGPYPMALCQLDIEYSDGSRETVGTDEAWRGNAAGPIVSSDMLMGEQYDARREMPDWSGAGFNDAAWQPVRIEEKTVPREAQVGPSAKRTEELAVRAVTNPAKGVFIYDLGQNMVGWARLKVRGTAGSKVTLRFAEMLNPDGTLYTTNYRSARCVDEYILRGDRNAEIYEPHFTFRGFRYVEVTGYPGDGPPPRDAVTGIVVHSDTPRVGRMETSSGMVNQLLANIDWGQRGNFLSVPTDCPQRDERLGWMGDAQIFIRTATYNRDVASFFTKWLVDVADAQSPAGAFPDVAPRVAAGEGTAAWGDAGVICPWTQYLVYGDTRVLETHYDAMTRWVEYCRANSAGLLRPASGYGDWLSIAADTPRDVLATAYFAYSTQLVAETARVLGKTEDAAKYDALFAQIKAAFNRAYVSPEGRIKGNTQTVYVLALRFDLLPKETRAAAARYLTGDIALKQGHLSTGFVGVGYLCPVLTETGHMNTAYQLLNNDTFPSWGYSIKQGATTIWERWDGWTETKGFQDPGMNSFNHYSLGSVGEWLYGTVAGIDLDPARPGYKHIRIHPRPGGGLTFARAEYDSLHGRIVSGWERKPGLLELRVTIPANTTATVWVPSAERRLVRESDKDPHFVRGLTFLRQEPGFSVYEVESGSYRFQSLDAPQKARTARR